RLALVDFHDQAISLFLEDRRRKGPNGKGDARAARDFLRHLCEAGAVRALEPTVDESPLAILRR
ncbi:MAG TPA: hypothetical protein VME46_26135, partial [Acidimicrobiales bacterium]|nr:hypothetical protein [Acidimicrobiales bacterium]